MRARTSRSLPSSSEHSLHVERCAVIPAASPAGSLLSTISTSFENKMCEDEVTMVHFPPNGVLQCNSADTLRKNTSLFRFQEPQQLLQATSSRGPNAAWSYLQGFGYFGIRGRCWPIKQHCQQFPAPLVERLDGRSDFMLLLQPYQLFVRQGRIVGYIDACGFGVFGGRYRLARLVAKHNPPRFTPGSRDQPRLNSVGLFDMI